VAASDDAALADAKDNGASANTHTGYGMLGNRSCRGLSRFWVDPVGDAIPSYPSRGRATRVVLVVVGPEPFPLLSRRVLSQARVRRLIEHASGRVARNKIHPQYPSLPVSPPRELARVREVYDVLALNATARDSLSH
jgi:hypothetical protein